MRGNKLTIQLETYYIEQVNVVITNGIISTYYIIWLCRLHNCLPHAASSVLDQRSLEKFLGSYIYP